MKSEMLERPKESYLYKHFRDNAFITFLQITEVFFKLNSPFSS